ncbi:hypothetical protein [Novosphingobium sp. PhB55]|uniref:hypothetical protein n=1 Tax=Novosphingobium sp. PhB55 TaxID=2485106 RepID=UPI001FBAC948|nr:hypothetical protein [Novosphingobium sp. PhB55]
MNSLTPSLSSSDRMVLLSAVGEVPSASAAALKLPLPATSSAAWISPRLFRPIIPLLRTIHPD